MPFCYCHLQSSSLLCGKNSRRNSTVHRRNSRHFFPGIFSPALYSAARILGETVQYIDGTLSIFSWHVQSCCVLCGRNSRKNSAVHGRNSRHFFPGTFSSAVYSAARILGKTAEYMDGTVAIFFLASSVLLCTLRSESKENSKHTWTELSPIFYSS